ncbi:FAD-dependent monooxygenase [Kitasatospora sp. NBC_01287]|uniref:FAD-dependent monooxygenase n=1 Tax=Kitasatospora sp. NBC_01287 TaxID=2903573 RepID=UPI00224E73CB|nr:FAD-dependent monooxygenase [Kitasatospora sp. NBC_01287]MCX4751133.1 FAD-dependent monooxygenase [Kitasatospora sp. NBC_01287]
MGEIDVLVVGAGPVGLTAAAELRRHGVDCRIIDRLAAPQPYAKAVGVQPRTLELWEAMGLVREALDEAVPMRGQLLFVNGEPGPRIELSLPPEVPYAFAALPQYTTERLLAEHLAGYGTVVERGTELLDVEADEERVLATLSTPTGTERVRARYLVGCDGAHSRVRRAAHLSFEGDAFPEQYMLGDVEVDWDLPTGYGVRATHLDADGAVDDLLVCIPLPGRGRYRMSMMVPPELAAGQDGGAGGAGGSGGAGAPDGVTHGLAEGRGPELRHIQAVLDRLAPQPTRAAALRWSSTFRISHRLVDRYRAGRLFVAGDAAHIHPPTGAQGMNTGVQDAFNLAWKLALAVRGVGADDLLDSYHAERHPVGEEVVGRTVRHAREGMAADPDDLTTMLLREAQLLVGYPGSPLVDPVPGGAGAPDGGPAPGDRAPDCGGLSRDLAGYPQRLFDLLRGPRHTLLLHAGPDARAEHLHACAAAARQAAHGLLDSYVLLADGAGPPGLLLPAVRDAAGAFEAGYRPREGEAFVIRPDGHLGARLGPATPEALAAHLRRTFTPA